MKTVFNNRMLAHIWAQQNQSQGKSSNGQFYFKDKTIYSYRDSWPLATFINNNEVLLNSDRVSVTTSKHSSYVRNALKSDVKAWHVDRDIMLHPEAFLKMPPKRREKFLADKLAKEQAQTKIYKAHQAKKNREIKKAEKAGAEVALIKWRNNEELSYGEQILLRRYNGNIALRLKNPETVETTKGAEMPVKFAAKIWAQVKACAESKTSWQKNGHKLPAGHFEIDVIDAEGNIHAGCHFILFAEVFQLAEKLKL